MERAYWLAWSRLKGIGPVLLKRIYQHLGSLEAAWTASDRDLGYVEGLGPQTIAAIGTERATIDPHQLLAEHLHKNPDFWTPADPLYPKLLWEIPDPPPVLYWRGSLQQWQEEYTVAIVGTRNPSSYGLRWTDKVTTALVDQGFSIISGLAEGIDTAAHQSCLKAIGKPIAVIGTGVDRVYPSRNQRLSENIWANGLTLSEYPQGTPPDRSHFPRRNRIIAGLARATLVMEAPEGSGALITAYQANEYGRDVYVLPGSLDTKQAIGCLHLIQRGAQMILGIEALLELLGTMPTLPKQNVATPPQIAVSLTPLQETILAQILVEQAVNFDRVVQGSGRSVGEVSSTLLELEILGVIVQHPGMRYQRLPG